MPTKEHALASVSYSFIHVSLHDSFHFDQDTPIYPIFSACLYLASDITPIFLLLMRNELRTISPAHVHPLPPTTNNEISRFTHSLSPSFSSFLQVRLHCINSMHIIAPNSLWKISTVAFSFLCGLVLKALRPASGIARMALSCRDVMLAEER